MVLGHLVDSDGGCSSDVAAAEKASWRRWMSGGGAPKSRSLPMAVRVRDAQRVSWPAWSFRAPWWQFDKQVVDRISRAQRKILYDAMAFYQDESESLEEFFRRKSRVCTSHQWKMAYGPMSWPAEL